VGSIFHKNDRKGRKVWYVDYYAEGIRKRERVGYNEREAAEALQSRMTDIRRQKFDGIFPESDYYLSEIKQQYLSYSRTSRSLGSYEREEGIIQKQLIPVFGRTPLNQISREQVEDYRGQRIDQGKAPATINKELWLLKHIVMKAVEWGKIRTNQIADVKPLKTLPGRVRYLELEQIPTLLNACPAWLRPIVLIDMNTGMRRSEILSLRISNIDRRQRLIVLEETKNNERKAIPMNRTVWEVIESLPPRVDSPYLFREQDGKPIKPAKVSVAFKKACSRVGIKDFRLHDLRHHFASYLTMKGQPQRAVQELLGHKDPKMTARYSHLSPGYLESVVHSLDDLGVESGMNSGVDSG